MFIHNFRYTLKVLFKNKMLIFWTFAFPIILGTFFKMAFSNIEQNEQLDIIDIAIVSNETFDENEILKESFKELSNPENDKRLFDTSYVNEKEAKKLLEDDKITGYLNFTDKPEIVVKSSGINETILKYVTDEIIQYSNVLDLVIDEKIKGISTSDIEDYNIEEMYTKIYSEVNTLMNENKANIKDISSHNLSYTMIEFYTLIAMACLYGGILGMVAINQNLANMSNKGKRVAISPTSKASLVISSSLASYVTQLIGLALLFIYTIFVLDVDYGSNLPLIILLTLTGALAGLSLGIVVACLFKTNDNAKTGILISITMLGCFLSGMMGITMKYVVDKNIPIVNKLNPANMITDGFYSLYYYDTLDRFFFNVFSLLIFSFIMITISIGSLRRQTYDSI